MDQVPPPYLHSTLLVMDIHVAATVISLYKRSKKSLMIGFEE